MTPAPRLPTIDTLGLKPPVFIRKVPSPNSYDPPNQMYLFHLDREIEHSIYLIETNDDLYKAVLAINAENSPKSIDLVWIKPDELSAHNIPYQQTDGKNYCRDIGRKKLHYDAQIDKAKPSDTEALQALLRALGEEPRQKKRITTGEMKLIAALPELKTCQSIKGNRDNSINCNPCIEQNEIVDISNALPPPAPVPPTSESVPSNTKRTEKYNVMPSIQDDISHHESLLGALGRYVLGFCLGLIRYISKLIRRTDHRGR